MINTDISQNSYLTHINSSSTNIIELLKNQIHYFQNLIQKTIISIQKYKHFDILGPNELNNGIHKLEQLYKTLSNNNPGRSLPSIPNCLPLYLRPDTCSKTQFLIVWLDAKLVYM